MLDFSFLGRSGQNMNNLPAYDVATAPINSGGGGSNFMDMLINVLKDPNIIRTMGDVGAKLSGEGSFGEAVGTGASNLVRNQQLQKAGEKQSNLHKMIIDAITGKGDVSKIVGPKEDMNTANQLTLKGDGSYTLSGGIRDPKVIGYQEEKPLESLKGIDRPLL